MGGVRAERRSVVGACDRHHPPVPAHAVAPRGAVRAHGGCAATRQRAQAVPPPSRARNAPTSRAVPSPPHARRSPRRPARAVPPAVPRARFPRRPAQTVAAERRTSKTMAAPPGSSLAAPTKSSSTSSSNSSSPKRAKDVINHQRRRGGRFRKSPRTRQDVLAVENCRDGRRAARQPRRAASCAAGSRAPPQIQCVGERVLRPSFG